MAVMNQARGFAYLFGVLKNQQSDPYCRSCNSFVKTLAAARENLSAFEAQYAEEIRNLPAEFSRLFDDAQRVSAAVKRPENPVGQKKAGNCKLPEGVCFIKSSLSILQKAYPSHET
jgi:hypothetical protein